jgi:hypothetical protein
VVFAPWKSLEERPAPRSVSPRAQESRRQF